MLRHKPDANFLADSSFSKEKFFYIARQKGNTNILQKHRWSFVQLQKIPQNPFRFTDSINARWEELFSATKSVHCTRCTLCIATPTDICVIDCAISSYISWSRQYIYEYIFSVYGSSSEFTSAHSTQSKSIDFCPSSYQPSKVCSCSLCQQALRQRYRTNNRSGSL